MTATRLELLELEGRVNPTGTFFRLLTNQHVDLAFDYTGGQWQISSQVGTARYQPNMVLHHIHSGTGVARPAGSQWDFIGVPSGHTIYVAPQTQNTSFIYLGASTEGTDPFSFAEYDEPDPRVVNGDFPWLTIQLQAVRGPGHFAVWTTNSFGTPTPWISTSQSGIDPSDKLLLLEGGHAHYNWAFTAPGRYEVDFRASAYAGPGMTDPFFSETRTFYFQVADTLKVTSIVPTETGFIANFNRAIDITNLNLYDVAGGTLGLADVTLVGASTGPVRGSLVIPTARIPIENSPNPPEYVWVKAVNAVEFIRTGGPLLPDTYTLTLRAETGAYSTNKGFRSLAGVNATTILDGNGDGITGDSYVGGFIVTSSTARTVSVPDFVRGFNQNVNLPAHGAGLPITIDQALGVTQVAFELEYNPNLLTISGAVLGANLPGDYTVTLTPVSDGRIAILLQGTTPLPAGPMNLLQLTAAVPATAPYADKQVLRIRNLQLNGGLIASRADHGVHIVAFLGDTTGNRGYSGLDSSNIVRVIQGIDSGFTAFQNADPWLLADTSGNSILNTLDVQLLAQKTVGVNIPLIPDLPVSGNPPAGGPDPRLFIPTTLTGTPGSTVTVPVRVDVTEPSGVSFRSFDLAIAFDPTRFSAANARVIGTLASGFTIISAINNTTGTIRITAYAANNLTLANGTVGDLVLIDFSIKATTAPGASTINLLANAGTSITSMNEGLLTLSPAPTNGPFDVNVDGTLTVGTSQAVTSFQVNSGEAQRSRIASLQVTFANPVTGLTSANFQIVGFPGTVTATPNGTNTVYTLTFSGPGWSSGSLINGTYTLNVVGVPGLSGQSSFQFHRLFGDANGDRVVDMRDTNLFRASLHNPAEYWMFDYDNDGQFSSVDYVRFFRQFRRRI